MRIRRRRALHAPTAGYPGPPDRALAEQDYATIAEEQAAAPGDPRSDRPRGQIRDGDPTSDDSRRSTLRHARDHAGELDEDERRRQLRRALGAPEQPLWEEDDWDG